MQQIIAMLTNKQSMKLIAQVEDAFKNLPHLPKGLSQFLVSIAPWLAGLFGVLGALGALSTFSLAFGMGSMYSWMNAFIKVNSAYYFIAGMLGLLSSILLLMSFKPLQHKKTYGWILLFWDAVLSIVAYGVGILFGVQGVLGAVISLAIGFYLLFEMKPFYSDNAEEKK